MGGGVLIFKVFNYFRRKVWVMPDMFTLLLRRKITLIMLCDKPQIEGKDFAMQQIWTCVSLFLSVFISESYSTRRVYSVPWLDLHQGRTAG